jgi:hypothetical protein
MKEDTRFESGGILLKAIEFVMKKYDVSRKNKKNFEDLLDVQKQTQQNTANASQKGNEVEKIHIARILEDIKDTKTQHNDFAIKLTYGLKGQGIDHVLTFTDTNIVVLVQDKLGKRIGKDKIESFVDSVKEFRAKFPEKFVYSLFINGQDSVEKTHYYLMDDLICNNCLHRRATESDIQFKTRIKTKIQEIYEVFSN